MAINQRIFSHKFQRYIGKISLVLVTILLLVLGNGGFKGPVLAERLPMQNVVQQVYKVLPDLPLENNYTNRKTGQIDKDNTLVSRLIRYHLFVKGRPAIYRLDWKFTLADYLGVNELMEKTLYPGHDTLTENPLKGDISVIDKLNRQQRETLVNTLVEIYNPPKPTPQTTPTPSPTPAPQTTPTPTGTGADLLK